MIEKEKIIRWIHFYGRKKFDDYIMTEHYIIMLESKMVENDDNNLQIES